MRKTPLVRLSIVQYLRTDSFKEVAMATMDLLQLPVEVEMINENPCGNILRVQDQGEE